MNAEDQLVKELQENEQILQIISYDDLVKEWEATKPYAMQGAGFVSPVNDSVTAAKLLSEFGLKPNKVVIKQYGGKKYVIFKGYPGARKIFRGTRYLTENPKVVRMAVGPKGVADSVKGGFVITVVLSVGIEVFDYFIRDTATLPELLGNVTGDLVKIGLSSIAAAAAGLMVGSAAIVGTVAAAPLIAAIAVGVIVGWALDKIDSKIGATAALIKAYENLGIKLREIEYEVGWWYNYFERNPAEIMRLFGGSVGPYMYGSGY
jgi:hypothetical protein